MRLRKFLTTSRHRRFPRRLDLRAAPRRAITALQMTTKHVRSGGIPSAEAVNQPRRPLTSSKDAGANRKPREILLRACPAAAQLPHRSELIANGDRPGGPHIKGITSAPTQDRTSRIGAIVTIASTTAPPPRTQADIEADPPISKRAVQRHGSPGPIGAS